MSTIGEFDTLRLGLPPAALAKLRLLQDQRDAAFAVSLAARDKVDAARAALLAAKRELDLVQEYGRKADPKDLARAQALHDQAAAEVKVRRQRQEEVAQEAQKAGQCLSSVEAWVRRNAGSVEFRPHEGNVVPQLGRGETVADAVARVRGQIAELKADAHKIASAPMTAIEAKAAARAEIEKLAEAGTPYAGRVLEGGEIRWPRHNAVDFTGKPIGSGVIHVHALLAWLHKPALLARLEAEIDSLADDRVALSAVQRRAETARVRAEKLAAERIEEALIASAPLGFTIHRRADADPRAVLGLADDLPAYAY